MREENQDLYLRRKRVIKKRKANLLRTIVIAVFVILVYFLVITIINLLW